MGERARGYVTAGGIAAVLLSSFAVAQEKMPQPAQEAHPTEAPQSSSAVDVIDRSKSPKAAGAGPAHARANAEAVITKAPVSVVQRPARSPQIHKIATVIEGGSPVQPK